MRVALVVLVLIALLLVGLPLAALVLPEDDVESGPPHDRCRPIGRVLLCE
jgi:hypothetical protein